jgi:hypothetical protein
LQESNKESGQYTPESMMMGIAADRYVVMDGRNVMVVVDSESE